MWDLMEIADMFFNFALYNFETDEILIKVFLNRYVKGVFQLNQYVL